MSALTIDNRELGLVHDYLLVLRGAERTFAAMADIWPGAPVYTLLYDREGTENRFEGHPVTTSPLQRTGTRQSGFRKLLPLFPLAVERLPVEEHSVIVSSSSAFAHGVRPPAAAVHVCYCHSPFRYAWFERERAMAEVPPPVRPAVGGVLAGIRRWDLRASGRVTRYVANSLHTQRRIREFYGREASIIHPPVEVERFYSGEPDDYFLAVTELVPHKRIEVAAQAASDAGQRLKVVGGGPELERLRERYRKRVEFLGRVDDQELVELYAHARALILPNVEEFGIAAVEAQAAGRPVIAAAAGGALETVQEGVTGQFVPPGDAPALKKTLREFDPGEFDHGAIREHAHRFSAEAFRERFAEQVQEAVEESRPRKARAEVRSSRSATAVGPGNGTNGGRLPESPVFAASAGGHLDLLRAIAPEVLGSREPVWVTSQTPRGEGLRDSAAQVELLPEYGRSPHKALANVVEAARLVARRRPRTVITSGAGVVAPFCVLARLSGAHIVYMETMARVDSPSMTARVLSRLAGRVLVQWPELAERLPRAVVCRPTLLEDIAEGEAPAGAGTLIAVGTHAQPYSRLLEIVARGIEEEVLRAPVRAQTGPAEWSVDGARATAFMSREELDAAVRSAELVVCHAGAGIISAALAAGHRPIVIPRRAALGEHVDDHQYQLTRKLAEWGLVVPVEDRITAVHVEAARRPLQVPSEIRDRPSAAEVLRAELRAPALRSGPKRPSDPRVASTADATRAY